MGGDLRMQFRGDRTDLRLQISSTSLLVLLFVCRLPIPFSRTDCACEIRSSRNDLAVGAYVVGDGDIAHTYDSAASCEFSSRETVLNRQEICSLSYVKN